MIKKYERLPCEELFRSEKSNWDPLPTMSPGTERLKPPTKEETTKWVYDNLTPTISHCCHSQSHRHTRPLLTECEREGNILRSYTLSVSGRGHVCDTVHRIHRERQNCHLLVYFFFFRPAQPKQNKRPGCKPTLHMVVCLNDNFSLSLISYWKQALSVSLSGSTWLKVRRQMTFWLLWFQELFVFVLLSKNWAHFCLKVTDLCSKITCFSCFISDQRWTRLIEVFQRVENRSLRFSSEVNVVLFFWIFFFFFRKL